MCNPSMPPSVPRDLELGGIVASKELASRPLLTAHSQSKGCNRSQDNDQSTASASSSSSRARQAPNADAGFGSSVLNSLPPHHQMVLLSFLMFLFFGMHNVLQEAIVNLLSAHSSLRGNSTLMLGYAEVIGVLTFSYLERVHMTSEGGWDRVAPLRSYPLLTACLFASSSLSNLSLSYINFPTKVVFRSCKLVPTMVIATIVNQRKFKSYEYLCALCICAGLVLFALADYKLDPLQYSPTGLLLVSGSVVADAILPNAQEHLFKDGSSRLEVTVFSNLYSFLGMTAITLMNGSLVQFVRGLSQDSTLTFYFGVYTVLSYISISCYMTLVKRFGGVTAVVLTTARKAMTILLSFLLFPKGFSWLYVHGSVLVLGAVMVASICKKLGGSGNKPRRPAAGTGGEYSLAYRNGGGDEESAPLRRPAQQQQQQQQRVGSSGSRLPEDSSSSHLESSAEAILEGIAKRAYV